MVTVLEVKKSSSPDEIGRLIRVAKWMVLKGLWSAWTLRFENVGILQDQDPRQLAVLRAEWKDMFLILECIVEGVVRQMMILMATHLH